MNKKRVLATAMSALMIVSSTPVAAIAEVANQPSAAGAVAAGLNPDANGSQELNAALGDAANGDNLPGGGSSRAAGAPAFDLSAHLYDYGTLTYKFVDENGKEVNSDAASLFKVTDGGITASDPVEQDGRWVATLKIDASKVDPANFAPSWAVSDPQDYELDAKQSKLTVEYKTESTDPAATSYYATGNDRGSLVFVKKPAKPAEPTLDVKDSAELSQADLAAAQSIYDLFGVSAKDAQGTEVADTEVDYTIKDADGKGYVAGDWLRDTTKPGTYTITWTYAGVTKTTTVTVKAAYMLEAPDEATLTADQVKGFSNGTKDLAKAVLTKAVDDKGNDVTDKVTVDITDEQGGYVSFRQFKNAASGTYSVKFTIGSATATTKVTVGEAKPEAPKFDIDKVSDAGKNVEVHVVGSDRYTTVPLDSADVASVTEPKEVDGAWQVTVTLKTPFADLSHYWLPSVWGDSSDYVLDEGNANNKLTMTFSTTDLESDNYFAKWPNTAVVYFKKAADQAPAAPTAEEISNLQAVTFGGKAQGIFGAYPIEGTYKAAGEPTKDDKTGEWHYELELTNDAETAAKYLEQKQADPSTYVYDADKSNTKIKLTYDAEAKSWKVASSATLVFGYNVPSVDADNLDLSAAGVRLVDEDSDDELATAPLADGTYKLDASKAFPNGGGEWLLYTQLSNLQTYVNAYNDAHPDTYYVLAESDPNAVVVLRSYGQKWSISEPAKVYVKQGEKPEQAPAFDAQQKLNTAGIVELEAVDENGNKLAEDTTGVSVNSIYGFPKDVTTVASVTKPEKQTDGTWKVVATLDASKLPADAVKTLDSSFDPSQFELDTKASKLTVEFQTGTGKFDKNFYSSTGNLGQHAKLVYKKKAAEPVEATVQVNLNDGVDSGASVTGTVGQKLNDLEWLDAKYKNPTRKGYKFLGYKSSATGKVEQNPTISAAFEIFTAQWEAEQEPTLTTERDEATLTSSQIKGLQDDDQAKALRDAFGVKATAADGSDATAQVRASSINQATSQQGYFDLLAGKPGTYTVIFTFDAANDLYKQVTLTVTEDPKVAADLHVFGKPEDTTTESEVLSAHVGDKLSEVPGFELSPTKDGWKFGGWFLDKEYTKPANGDTTVDSAWFAVYAKWERTNTYALEAKSSTEYTTDEAKAAFGYKGSYKNGDANIAKALVTKAQVNGKDLDVTADLTGSDPQLEVTVWKNGNNGFFDLVAGKEGAYTVDFTLGDQKVSTTVTVKAAPKAPAFDAQKALNTVGSVAVRADYGTGQGYQDQTFTYVNAEDLKSLVTYETAPALNDETGNWEVTLTLDPAAVKAKVNPELGDDFAYVQDGSRTTVTFETQGAEGTQWYVKPQAGALFLFQKKAAPAAPEFNLNADGVGNAAGNVTVRTVDQDGNELAKDTTGYSLKRLFGFPEDLTKYATASEPEQQADGTWKVTVTFDASKLDPADVLVSQAQWGDASQYEFDAADSQQTITFQTDKGSTQYYAQGSATVTYKKKAEKPTPQTPAFDAQKALNTSGSVTIQTDDGTGKGYVEDRTFTYVNPEDIQGLVKDQGKPALNEQTGNWEVTLTLDPAAVKAKANPALGDDYQFVAADSNLTVTFETNGATGTQWYVKAFAGAKVSFKKQAAQPEVTYELVAKKSANVTPAEAKAFKTGADFVRAFVTKAEADSKDATKDVEASVSAKDSKDALADFQAGKEGTYTVTFKLGDKTATTAVTIKANNGGGSTGGNGGGSSTPTTPSYKVVLPETIDGGSVETNGTSFKSGQTVTVKPASKDGYRLVGLKVTDKDGKQLTITDGADGAYAFEMPSSDVTLEPVFTKVEPKSFADVADDQWYKPGVDYASANGLMNGYEGSNDFGVGKSLTRGELATLLFNNAKPGDSFNDYHLSQNQTGLADVLAGQFYTPAANWAVKNQIINGYSDAQGNRTGFGPNDAVTLEQLLTILSNYADKDGANAADTSVLSGFVDGGSVDPWAAKSVAWAVQKGLVHGYDTPEGRRLDPIQTISRERVATVLLNAKTLGIL